MKTGVHSIAIKLKDPEVKDSLMDILEDPGSFHGQVIEDVDEFEVSERTFTIVEQEGTGKIEPWTRIILKVDTSETPVDMLIALDTSYSMITGFEETTRFNLAVDGIISLTEKKAKKLIIGIMAYGVDWEMSQDMTNAKSFTKKKITELKKELADIKHKGKAACGTALNGALEVFTIKGLNDLKVVVLLTDGADEIGPNPLKEAEKLNSRGIYIYPFYFGEEKDQKSLTIFGRIASKSHTELFNLHTAAEEEKRRLIRASLRTAEEETGDESEPGSEDAEAEGETDGSTDKPSADDASEEGVDDPNEDKKEDIAVPSGAELLTRKLSEIGTALTFVIQEGGQAPASDDDGDVQVIKAGIPVEEDKTEDTDRITFRRTPKIIDAIKNFIEWVKGLIW